MTSPAKVSSLTARFSPRTASGRRRYAGRLIAVAVPLAAACLLAASGAAAQTNTHGAWSFISSPGLHPPSVSVTVQAPGTAPGYLFVAPIRNSGMPGAFLGQAGPLILDGRGNPVWEHPAPRGQVAMNFHPQTYRGAPVLTWWQGKINYRGFGSGEDVIVDGAYHTIGVVRGANGYHADLHEFYLTSDGNALITAYRPVSRNLARWHGPGNGQVLDSVVQEINVKTGRLVWQWDPLRHISLDESYTAPGYGYAWDAFHLNSMDVDAAGNILISARNTWGIYYVSRRSGAIEWRLGGKRSSFSLGPGVRFAYQHDARFQPGGDISVFDDGAAPAVEKQSRGLVVRLDTVHRAAYVARQYTHPHALLAGSQGNTQVLPNDDVFEGWGAEPYFSEFTQSGQLLFDAHFHGPDQTYRAFRVPWTGRVAHGPALTARQSGGRTTLYASWNGETDIAGWQLLAGPSPDRLAPAGTVSSQGFETAATPQGSGPYYQVKAFDSAGHTLGTSGAIRP